MRALMIDPSARFPLGQVVLTKAAQEKLLMGDIMDGLLRHSRGDWGDVSDAGRQENERSLTHGYRMMSVYHADEATKFWIITEADRSVTTVLLPDDY